MSELQYGRNCEILRRKRDGGSYKSIAEEFGITPVRVRQICEDTRNREHRSIDDIPEILQAVKQAGAPERIYTQIVHALYKSGDLRYNRWMYITRHHMLSLENIGERCADILEHAQEIAGVK